ncbi:hypothetical protein D3C76_1034390 [compost metagenome]
MTLSCFSHHSQTFHTYALEAVRSCTGLKRASTKYLSTRRFNKPGDLINLLWRLNGARSAHDHQVFSTNLHTLDINNRILRMEIPAGQLVGFGDLHDVLYTLHLPQMLGELRSDASH